MNNTGGYGGIGGGGGGNSSSSGGGGGGNGGEYYEGGRARSVSSALGKPIDLMNPSILYVMLSPLA